MKKIIDVEKWERKETYSFFSKMDYPYLTISNYVDVSNIYKIHKEKKSFYALISYCVLKTINEIDEFKYGSNAEEIFYSDKADLSFSVLKEDKNVAFSEIISLTEFNVFINTFVMAKNDAENNAENKNNTQNNLIYITTIPWINFTSFINPMDLKRRESVTRISIGKYIFGDLKCELNLSIQVHHGFLDGSHVGLFFQRLQENIEELR